MADSQAIDANPSTESESIHAPVSDTGQAPTFDMAGAVEKIGDQLFVGKPSDAPPSDDPQPKKTARTFDAPSDDTDADAQASKQPTPEPPPHPTAPKSWPKEMHPYWEKMPKEAQTYWGKREKQMIDGISQYKEVANFGSTLADVLRPYESVIHQQGIDAPGAVKYLLEAHTLLTTGPMDGRVNAFRKLGADLGLLPYLASNQVTQPANGSSGHDNAAMPPDPRINDLTQQVQNMQQFISRQHESSLQETSQRVMKEIEAFASDPAHSYFDDVADDIVLYIQAGLSLPDAYDKAVWANEVTRTKEMERRKTEALEKDKENARLQALPKKKAASVNIHGSESQRSPTEPVGDLTDTLRQTYREIQGRSA